jgi:pyrroline-5-carboxylate reductase
VRRGVIWIALSEGIHRRLPRSETGTERTLDALIPSRTKNKSASPEGGCGGRREIIYTRENNLLAIRESGTVILACRPGDLDGILNTDGIRFELSRKLVISVLQTRTAQEIVDALNDWVQVNGYAANLVPTLVRAAPNLAAGWKCSMTIIENREPLPEDKIAMVTWIFERVGQVKFLFGDAFCAGAMLASGGPAVMSVAVSGIFDGCVEGGLTQAETIAIGHQMLIGLVAPLNRPHHLLHMRESAASCPKAPTIKTLNKLEKQGVRGLFADAMVEGIECVP